MMTSLRAYVEYPCEQDGSLQSVCPLNGCCKEESASYCTKYQRNRKRRSEDVASTGRGVVRASPFCENKTAKIYSEGSGRFSAKICTNENFPLYGILVFSKCKYLHVKNCKISCVTIGPIFVMANVWPRIVSIDYLSGLVL